LAFFESPTVIAMPPRTRAHDKINFSVIISCIKIIPPAAAINGTLSCDTAAFVDGIFGKT
jgi:hypothetical protein